MAKLATTAAGGIAATMAAPAAPGRISLLVAIGMPAAGFVVPDALLEREARRRRRRLVGALPDALDLLAVSATSGRSSAAGFEELSNAGEGPLADELRVTVAELSCGQPLSEALDFPARPGPGQRAGDLSRLDRALPPLRLPAGGPAPPPIKLPAQRPAPRRRGAGGPGRSKDPARRRPRPRPLGPTDDRRRPDRQRRTPVQRLLATPAPRRATGWRPRPRRRGRRPAPRRSPCGRGRSSRGCRRPARRRTSSAPSRSARR